MAGSDTDSEYESGAPGPSTKKKLCMKIVHKKCVTTYSRHIKTYLFYIYIHIDGAKEVLLQSCGLKHTRFFFNFLYPL